MAYFSVSSEQRIPTQWITLPLSFACATCQPIVGFCQALQICFHLKPFSLRVWCKGQRKATASPHPGTNFGSKVRDSPVTLTCWPFEEASLAIRFSSYEYSFRHQFIRYTTWEGGWTWTSYHVNNPLLPVESRHSSLHLSHCLSVCHSVTNRTWWGETTT